MKTYCYLLERKLDGKKFCTFGNFKEHWNRPSYLYEFVPETYAHSIETPFGPVYNISRNIKHDPKKYRVVRQLLMP